MSRVGTVRDGVRGKLEVVGGAINPESDSGLRGVVSNGGTQLVAYSAPRSCTGGRGGYVSALAVLRMWLLPDCYPGSVKCTKMQGRVFFGMFHSVPRGNFFTHSFLPIPCRLAMPAKHAGFWCPPVQGIF